MFFQKNGGKIWRFEKKPYLCSVVHNYNTKTSYFLTLSPPSHYAGTCYRLPPYNPGHHINLTQTPLMIKINDISFSYPHGLRALQSATGILEPGIHLLLGENGAGKTTLLKVMAGLLNPSEGKVLIDGKPVSGHSPEVMRSLFFLPETMEIPFATFDELARYHSPMYPFFSGEDFAQNLQDFGINPSTRLADCSLGTRRKGLIAYALALHTPLLLMDEPANGLDINSKKAMRAMMARCVAPEQTVVVSTHNIGDLMELYDGLMLLHGGKLEVCLPTYTLACRLECVAASEPIPDALYWEMSAGRYLSLMPNPSGEPASLDYSLLYSALMSTAAPQVLAAANRTDHLSHPVKKVHES